jgi:hypothetical protein
VSTKSSIRALQIARVLGTSLSIACGVKAGSSAMRATRWRGGSEVIGGAPPPLTGGG